MVYSLLLQSICLTAGLQTTKLMKSLSLCLSISLNLSIYLCLYLSISLFLSLSPSYSLSLSLCFLYCMALKKIWLTDVNFQIMKTQVSEKKSVLNTTCLINTIFIKLPWTVFWIPKLFDANS